jgi:dTDP-glucose 4,6-dehydratase
MAHELEQDLQHIFQHTQAVWPRLAGSNIFLTGGTGFVGSWLLESLLWANRQLDLRARMLVLTRDPAAFGARRTNLARSPDVEFLTGDLKTFSLPSRQLHYVIHAAVEHQAPGQNSSDSIRANAEGTRRLLEMARTHGTQTFLYTSSGAVYGEQPAALDKIPEHFTGTYQPGNSYAESKRESETLCTEAASRGITVVIARLFAFVGPYLPLNQNFAVGNFVRDAAAGGPIRVEGDGTPVRSYLYAADLAIWLWILLANGESARPYNVGSDQAIDILELAHKVASICGVTRGISMAKAHIPGAKPQRYVPSIARAKTELGLEPWIPLDEGIRRMFLWHQRNNAMLP